MMGMLPPWGIEYCGVEELALATENFDSSLVQIYPNPAKTELLLSLKKNAGCRCCNV
jgi:hypothetical protein